MTNPVALFLSPAGRLSSTVFWLPVVLVYVLGIASLFLPSSAGYWLFGCVQLVLAWSWYALHAKRLRDAARTTSPAVAIAILYLLALAVLLAGVMMSSARLLGSGTATAGTLPGPGAALLILVLYLIGVSSEAGGAQALGLMLASVVFIAALPALLAIGFSIWVGTRPTVL